MKASRLILNLVAFFATSFNCHAASHPGQMLAQLNLERSTVQWDASSVITADFNGDGKKDVAVLGYTGKTVVLAIQIAVGKKLGRLDYLEFAVDSGVQAAICTAPAKLEIYPLHCTTEEGALPGCKASLGTSGLSIVDGECDSIHLYWSHASKRMQWWRR